MRLIITDACPGLVQSVTERYPEAGWQRCVVLFHRNLFGHMPAAKVREVAQHMLKAIHAQEGHQAAQDKAAEIVAKLGAIKRPKASERLEGHLIEPLTFYGAPDRHWIKSKSNNPPERILREIRRRARVVGARPHEKSWLILAAPSLRDIAGTKWSIEQYLKLKSLTRMTDRISTRPAAA